jgi:hypothetical protein
LGMAGKAAETLAGKRFAKLGTEDVALLVQNAVESCRMVAGVLAAAPDSEDRPDTYRGTGRRLCRD